MSGEGIEAAGNERVLGPFLRFVSDLVRKVVSSLERGWACGCGVREGFGFRA